MEIYTIGFTKKSAEQFFTTLRQAGIKRLVDVRLNNTSQLAAFAKRDDLEFFLKEICGAEYVHEPNLAPTEDILKAYKKKEIQWDEFEQRFTDIMHDRNIETAIDKRLFDVPAVLLCSEPTAENCHRRLVAEHLQSKWEDIEITHL